MTTIEQYEGLCWGDPPPDATTLVRRCHELARVHVANMEPGDLRLLLLQQIAVALLLGPAVQVLFRDPLIEGTWYPGDLLHAVLELDEQAWLDAGLAERAKELAQRLTDPKIEAYLREHEHPRRVAERLDPIRAFIATWPAERKVAKVRRGRKARMAKLKGRKR